MTPLTDVIGHNQSVATDHSRALEYCMDEKTSYVEHVLGFMFKDGFARRFEELGSPLGDLDIWYKNAQVYVAVTAHRTPQDSERIRLATLIEAIRLEAMVPPIFGEQYEFDVAPYEFSEDVLAYKMGVIEAVLRQEASSPSVLDM